MNIVERIKSYFDNPALSQSELKGLMYGLHRYKIEKKNPLYFEEKTALLMGTLVGDILSHTKEEFDSKYYVGEIKRPTTNIESIIRQAYDGYKKEPTDRDAHILAAAKLHNYGKDKYSDKVILEKVKKEEDYWEALESLEGKTLITNEEYDTAKHIASSIKTHEFTKSFFENEGIYETDLYFEWRGIKCKALLDYMVVINRVLYPIDFKIPEYNTQFELSSERFNYPFQGAYYTQAILENKEYLKSVLGDFDSVASFHFITGSRKGHTVPLIYVLSRRSHKKALSEIDDGLDKYLWHESFDIWDMDRDIYLNKGIFQI